MDPIKGPNKSLKETTLIEGGSHLEVETARLVRVDVGDLVTDATVVQLDLVAADHHGRALPLPRFFLALGLCSLILA